MPTSYAHTHAHTHTRTHTHTHAPHRALVELIDIREKPIDEALRQLQQIFRMPVRV